MNIKLLSALLLLLASRPLGASPGVQVASRSVKTAAGQTFNCSIVTIDLKLSGLSPRLVTARGGIGKTETFASMVARTHALCAINGSFFDAYNTVGDKDPGMTLISEGSVIHKGGTGTVIGFTADRIAVMGKLELPIKGTVTKPGSRPKSWYAYWLNRTPTSADNIAVFTPARGDTARVSDGLSVVVRANSVVRVVPGDTAIPRDGFVINFRGDSAPEAAKFPLGAIVSYSVARKAERDVDLWTDVQEAVGAGPRLLTDGVITYSPESEGFTSPKILSQGGKRCAIGITRDGKILLVTAAGPTVQQLAGIMLALGANNAMNLDGGASSGLYGGGSMIAQPGRELSNALVFVPAAAKKPQ